MQKYSPGWRNSLNKIAYTFNLYFCGLPNTGGHGKLFCKSYTENKKIRKHICILLVNWQNSGILLNISSIELLQNQDK
jgi:hypothetical protein